MATGSLENPSFLGLRRQFQQLHTWKDWSEKTPSSLERIFRIVNGDMRYQRLTRLTNPDCPQPCS